MTTETTRRALFGGAGLVALAAAVPAVAGARHGLAQSNEAAMPAVNPRLLRVIALRDRVEAECDRFDEEVELPARRACWAEKEALPAEKAPPHREVATTYVNLFGETVRLSTARASSVASARQMVRDPQPSDMDHPDWRQARLELVALADERDAIIAAQTARRKAREAKIDARHQVARLAARSLTLVDRSYALRSAAIAMPATSLADILTKLEFVDRVGCDGDPDFVLASITADVRRLTGEGR
jgi:hypothetical protein